MRRAVHHDAHCRLPDLFKQGFELVESSKGITDLLLPQTSLCYTYTVPPRSNQTRTTPETFQKTEVSLVNGINQTTSLHQLRAARHHHTQRRQHQRQTTTQHGTTRRNDASHTVPTTQNHNHHHRQQQKTSNNKNQPQPHNGNSISNSNSFGNSNRNNGHVRKSSAPSSLSLYLYTVATSLRTETSSCTCTIFSCPLMSVPTRVFRPARRHMYRIIAVSAAVTNSELPPTEDYICICFCNQLFILNRKNNIWLLCFVGGWYKLCVSAEHRWRGEHNYRLHLQHDDSLNAQLTG